VDVIAPFFDSAALNETASLGIALVIGIAFGWFLERSGMGSARKLAGQFYLRDLTVFKVMFTAIITATLGLFWLGWLGVLDVDRIFVPETWILPQLVGGVVFGAGFAISGLCPGTSCVAAATGRIDGITVVAGMFAGVLGTGLLYSKLQGFYLSTPRGVYMLPQLFNVSQGVLVFLLVLLALAGFYAAEKIERRAARNVVE
jgi:uncharacterized membrane protein YedE/YeeE